jgi:hypothetical protein
MRFKNRSRSRGSQKRNSRRNKMSYGGAFDSWYGTTMVSTDKQKKRLILSFENNIDDTNTNNIRIYIRVSLTNPKKRDFATESLPHIYLDVPISECSPSDIVKIKFLHMTWLKSLSEEAKAEIPDFRWIDAFAARWAEIDPGYKKAEFLKIQELFFKADYESIYGDLLKYEDPFGGSFDYTTPKSSFSEIDIMLEKMNRANDELEKQQKRLQTRRSQQAFKSRSR